MDSLIGAADWALAAAERPGLPALHAAVAEARAALDRLAARRLEAGAEQPLRLGEVAALCTSGAAARAEPRHDCRHQG